MKASDTIMSKKENVTLFKEGEVQLINYIVTSCATYLKVDVKEKNKKSDNQVTIELLKAMDNKLREDFYGSFTKMDEENEKDAKIKELEAKIKELEKDGKDAHAKKQPKPHKQIIDESDSFSEDE